MAKSLTILVDAQWLDHEQIAALIAKGHVVHTAPDADLILSANAHWWSDEMWKYFPVALKRARARKKEHQLVSVHRKVDPISLALLASA